jgi:acetoin utilization protein AcuB
MFVRMWMTKDVITAAPELPILEARDVMKQHMVRRLPVLKKDKLLGLVTQGDIQEAGPSGATSLSIWELNYLLARITVGEVMTKAEDLITVAPDDAIEQAALLMKRHKVGGLPVLERGKLVGIITESDIFDVLIEVMGIEREGTRLTLRIEDRPGALEEVLKVVHSYEANVLSVVTCEECRSSDDHDVVVIRIDHYDWRPIVKDLKDRGIQVLDART